MRPLELQLYAFKGTEECFQDKVPPKRARLVKVVAVIVKLTVTINSSIVKVIVIVIELK